jgi:hypothetical protein
MIPLDRSISEFERRASMLQTARGVFQSAVRTDPENADAKVNLEIEAHHLARLAGGPSQGELLPPSAQRRCSGAGTYERASAAPAKVRP